MHTAAVSAAPCAKILRVQNIPAAVWSFVDVMAHQPNEYVIIDNIVRDAQIFVGHYHQILLIGQK